MYLKWNEKTITDFSDDNINSLYNEGYIFGRPTKGYMYQSRSLRIDLSKFELSSENRRVLRKTKNLQITNYKLPITNYHWSIGKLAKDFYDTKFGKGTFSANKVRELFTTKHNFNKLFTYSLSLRGTESDEAIPKEEIATPSTTFQARNDSVGYAIYSETNKILHYAYPFYQLSNVKSQLSNVGMGMMLKAITWAKENNKRYIYLGSAQRPGDTYKLQFAGLEWFDGKEWQSDLGKLKNILSE